ARLRSVQNEELPNDFKTSAEERALYEQALTTAMRRRAEERGNDPGAYAKVYRQSGEIQRYLAELGQASYLASTTAPSTKIALTLGSIVMAPLGLVWAGKELYRAFLETHLPIEKWIEDARSVVKDPSLLPEEGFLSLDILGENDSFLLYM